MKNTKDEEGKFIESLKPKYTYNPILQHFYQCVQHRALHPHSPLPTLDLLIKKYIYPDEELFHKANLVFKNFKEIFPLEKTESKEKIERIYWKDSIQQQIRLDSYVPDPSKKKKNGR